MSSNLHRLNHVIPGSAKHTARAQVMEGVLEEIANNIKLVQAAMIGFRRIERALYYLNPLDNPNVELTRQQLSAKARCGFSTISNDLLAINNLFDAIGLRLQHWESGGWRINDGIEETVPSVYYWPSPGGRVMEESSEWIELAIMNKIIPGRDEQAERRIIKEMIMKEINNSNMKELLRERQINRQVREAKRLDRAEDKKAQAPAPAQGKVIKFPAGRPVTPQDLANSCIASFKANGITKDAAIRLILDHWDAEQ